MSRPSASLIDAFLAGEREATFQFARWVGLEIRAHRSPTLDRLREDLIQETLLRLVRALRRGEFRGESALQRYVRAVARHVLVDQLRDRSNRAVTGTTGNPTGTDEAPTAESRVSAREAADRVLAGLSEEDGRLLMEAFVIGRSYAEMAAGRGIRHGTLKLRVFRAARRARRLVERTGGG